MSDQRGKVLKFGPFELSIGNRRLTNSAKAVHLRLVRAVLRIGFKSRHSHSSLGLRLVGCCGGNGHSKAECMDECSRISLSKTLQNAGAKHWRGGRDLVAQRWQLRPGTGEGELPLVTVSSSEVKA
jgi:hypothetical protein